MPRLLVTGASGFVGNALSGALGAGLFPGWRMLPIDVPEIRDANAVRAAVEQHEFEAVLHLAAQTHVPSAIADPRTTLEVNVFGTLNLLSALRDRRFAGRILVASSGDVYGRVEAADLPIRETLAPRPRNPYAVSKVAAEALACQFGWSEGLDVVVARPFNHIGPGQSSSFAVSGLARQVARIKRQGRRGTVGAGNLESRRDFTDVVDVLAAYLALIERGRAAEIYNVCSGESRSIQEMLDTLLELAGVQAEIRRDERLLRPGEQTVVEASAEKLRHHTGWVPVRPLRTTLQQMLDHWESHDD